MSPGLLTEGSEISQPNSNATDGGLAVTKNESGNVIAKGNEIQLVSKAEPEEKDALLITDSQNSASMKEIQVKLSSPITSLEPDSISKVVSDVRKQDNETSVKAVEKAWRSQHLAYSKSLYDREKEDDKFDIRAKQAVLHLTWTDERIKQMEAEIRSLRRDVDGLPPDFEKRKQFRQPVYKHELRRSLISGFRLNDESKDIPDEHRPALEIMTTENIISRPTETSTTNDNDNTTSTTDTVDTEINPLPSSESEEIMYEPERLRIRSRALLSLLSRISGQELLANANTRSIDNPAPVVFLRPFKLFVAYEKEIRAEVPALKLKIKKEEQLEASKPIDSNIKTKDLPEFANSDLLQDLELLVEFFDKDLQPTFELRRKIEDGTLNEIQYQDLWHLFNPGDIVVDPNNNLEVYRVLDFTGGREILVDKINGAEPPVALEGFMVDSYNFNYNGLVYGPKLHTHSIRRFAGTQPISSLPIYPIKFDPSFQTLQANLLAQGRRFLEVTKTPYVHKLLIGTTLDEPPEEVDAQVIVDMTLAINKNPDWVPELKISEDKLTKPDRRETVASNFCIHYHKWAEGCCGSDVTHKDQSWDATRFNNYLRSNRQALGKRRAHEIDDDEDIMLLPFWVYGFVLRSRRWVTIKVSELSDVQYESTFNDLLLPENHKRYVQALVQDHAKTSASNSTATSKIGGAMDLVRGKGKGLILLLHGAPGVGKTSTAECVADLTQRPLFPVTCGDIGEKASEVQASLDYNFQLAHKWGCVLLLDEADVFLAKRSKADNLGRNAVVSVFLRSLEYYSGILFLTTNRVGSIDPAFKSRIHMSLYYPHLDEETTIKLYNVFIKRTTEEQNNSETKEFKIKPKEILKFAKWHYKRLKKDHMSTWNGRQIRNAFQTAVALVEYDSRNREPGTEIPSLGKAQFEIIAEASLEFDKYLNVTLRGTDADLAEREETRADKFSAQSLGKTAKNVRVAVRSVKRGAREPESELEISSDDSESESESEDDDEDEDEEEDEDEDKNEEEFVPKSNGNGKLGFTKGSKSMKKRKG